MLTAQVAHPKHLTAADREAWLDWCALTPAFQSPLLGPDFTAAVGAVRDDARVAVFQQGGRTVGFLPFHARPSGYARPIGSPFSDYHALITPPGQPLDGPQALAAAGVAAFRYSALVDPYGCFPPARGEQTDEGFVIALGEGGADAYVETLRLANPKRFKNWRRLENKLEREVGEITMTAPDRDQGAYDLLMRWKSEQLRRTGLHDFLGADWTRTLMQSLFDTQAGDFQGLMITLRAGGKVVAGHFGVRLGQTYHPWIASIDPEGGAWSPGQTLLSQAIRVMPRLDLTAYDLASSHAHYKAPFCLGRAPVRSGAATAATSAGRRRLRAEDAWAMAGEAAPVVGKLRRRMELIAAVELSTVGRVRGLIGALAAQGRRGRGTAGVDDALGGV